MSLHKEIARDVAGIASADHEESNPGAADTVIHRLTCALCEDEREVRLRPGSRFASIYERETIATLFQFELAALRGATPPVIVAFLRAAVQG